MCEVCGLHPHFPATPFIASSNTRQEETSAAGSNRWKEVYHEDLKLTETLSPRPTHGPHSQRLWTQGKAGQAALVLLASWDWGFWVRSFPELVGVSVVTVGDSSFTLSRRVFLRAAGEAFSWSAMDCSSLQAKPQKVKELQLHF